MEDLALTRHVVAVSLEQLRNCRVVATDRPEISTPPNSEREGTTSSVRRVGRLFEAPVPVRTVCAQIATKLFLPP